MNTDQTLTQLVQSLLEIGLMIAAGIIASAVRKYALVAATKLHIQLSEHDQATIDAAVHTMALVGKDGRKHCTAVTLNAGKAVDEAAAVGLFHRLTDQLADTP